MSPSVCLFGIDPTSTTHRSDIGSALASKNIIFMVNFQADGATAALSAMIQSKPAPNLASHTTKNGRKSRYNQHASLVVSNKPLSQRNAGFFSRGATGLTAVGTA
jgi:hypothetical protein